MFKLFFMNMWSNIKRSPIISVLLFAQIAVLSYCLMTILFNQNSSSFINDAYQGVYAENSMFDIRSYKMDQDEFAKASAGMFESLENTGLDEYEAFYEIVMKSEIIKTAVMTGSGIDSEYYSVDQDYINIFGLILDSGRLFTENEFVDLDVNCVPVILGYNYKKEYSIGDTFEYNILGNSKSLNMTYKVIGFISEGQIYFEPGGNGPYVFDDKIILPYISKSLEEWLDFYEQNEEYVHKKTAIRYYISGLGANILSGRHYLVEVGKESELIDILNNALKETGLDEFNKVGTVRRPTMLQTADELAEKTALLISLVIIMIAFSLISIVFSAINNVSNNMKAYAVHNLVGATQTQIILYTEIEVLIYCVLGLCAGFLWRYLGYVFGDYTSHPALAVTIENLILISALFTLLACIVSSVFVFVKVKNYSVSELIRGREIKKNKRQPIYKVMYLVMMALVSICITFLNSYNYQLDHIDKYQNNFWAKDVKLLYLNSLQQEDAPVVELYYDLSGVENYSVDLCINTQYDEINGPKVRGWFYKGDFGIPEITEGRFFTAEEVTKVSDYAVVGKNVIVDFGVERDGKTYITYRDKEYEVIGIAGRSGHDTTIDDWVFITLPSVIEQFGVKGRPIIIDGKTEVERNAVIDNIKAMSDGRYTYSEQEVKSKLDIGVSKNIINIFIALIFITAIVFCIYFIDKIKHIINVKKFLGYSKKMILLDTAVQFISLSSVAYCVGNLLMYAISKTLLKDIALFSAFQINLPVLTFSFGMILLIAFVFSIIAINKAFMGTARDLKR